MYGSFDGSLESTAKVSIRSTGSVSGNVIYKKMVRFFLKTLCSVVVEIYCTIQYCSGVLGCRHCARRKSCLIRLCCSWLYCRNIFRHGWR